MKRFYFCWLNLTHSNEWCGTIDESVNHYIAGGGLLSQIPTNCVMEQYHYIQEVKPEYLPGRF